MKHIVKFVVALLIPTTAFAQPYTEAVETDRLMNFGMSSELAVELLDYINGDGLLAPTLANNVYLKARNAAGSADINVLKVDATDDTVLNADTGDVVKIAIAGSTVATVDTTGIAGTGEITSSSTGSLGWSYVTGANTACTTTCTSAAVFGVDLAAGASSPVIVAASSATADACVCAGAS